VHKNFQTGHIVIVMIVVEVFEANLVHYCGNVNHVQLSLMSKVIIVIYLWHQLTCCYCCVYGYCSWAVH